MSGRAPFGPWFSMPKEAWEAIVESFNFPVVAADGKRRKCDRRPWPIEVVLADLCYWADRVKCGAERPSSKALAKRWEWTEWQVRQTLKAEWSKALSSAGMSSSATVPRPNRDGSATPNTEKAPESSDNRDGSATKPRPNRVTRVGTPSTLHPSPEGGNPPLPPLAGQPGLELQVDDDPAQHALAAPEWAVKAVRTTGVSPVELVAAVARVYESVHGRLLAPERGATAARPVVSLWRALGKPPLEDLATELVLVAQAAQQCPHPMFARDMRAEGWEGGTDRSRKLAAICRQGPPGDSSGATWDERLHTAREWDAAGRPAADWPAGPVRAPPDQGGRRGGGRRSVLQGLAEDFAELNSNQEEGGTWLTATRS